MKGADTRMHDQRLILVTGATGYIGSQLVPRLLELGYRVRVLARDPGRLQGRAWLTEVEVVEGDVLDAPTLAQAMQHVDSAYYLIHSLLGGAGFQQRDIVAARNFGTAAHAAGVQHIVYLGGLGESMTTLSQHLQSRQDTGEALRATDVPMTEFRAAIIVGAGSVSFEMIRYLTERVPIMICPRWVYTRIQPIAIMDVLRYLVAALENPASRGTIIEIGGSDILTYADMMLIYAQARGLKRWLVPVPVLTPRLSSYWVHWVTPIPAAIARPLIDGVRNKVIVRSTRARELFPDIQPVSYLRAVQMALAQLNAGTVESSWSDALSSSQGDTVPKILTTHEGMIMERRQRLVNAPPAMVYQAFTALGGNSGWLYANALWQIRGVLDRLLGGVGMRRGRRHPTEVRTGDAIDFWRVETVEPNHLLRLRAEMKVPGRAWLQFEVTPAQAGKAMLVQTAFFAPKGLLGLLYWYVLYPVHARIFSGMIQAVARSATRRHQRRVKHTQ